jgi:hypothetical protein
VRHSKVARPCPSWVISDVLTVSRWLPVYPDKQTFSLFVGIFKGASRRPSCSVQNERGRKWGQLMSLRNFLRISLRSSAYSSTIRRASSVREGLLGFSGPEAGSSSCGFMNGA